MSSTVRYVNVESTTYFSRSRFLRSRQFGGLQFISTFTYRCVAELLAGRAECHLRNHELDETILKAEAALVVHEGCGDAFRVRGQVQYLRVRLEQICNGFTQLFLPGQQSS